VPAIDHVQIALVPVGIDTDLHIAFFVLGLRSSCNPCPPDNQDCFYAVRPMARCDSSGDWTNSELQTSRSPHLNSVLAISAKGDESWRSVAYKSEATLFGLEDVKAPNEAIAEAFQKRLKEVAGFAYVPEPLPMRNSNNAIVYYLFFASAKKTAQKIVNFIFDKYKSRMS
jgi:hypothetical protein